MYEEISASLHPESVLFEDVWFIELCLLVSQCLQMLPGAVAYRETKLHYWFIFLYANCVLSIVSTIALISPRTLSASL